MQDRIQRWRDGYKATALIAFNSVVFGVLLLLLTNGVLGGLFWIWDSYFKNSNPVSRKYGEALVQAYPGWAAGDLNQMLKENWNRRLIYAPFTQFQESPID